MVDIDCVGSRIWRERILARRIQAQERAIHCNGLPEPTILAVRKLIMDACERNEAEVPVLRIEDPYIRTGARADDLRRYLERHNGHVLAHQYHGAAEAVVAWCLARGYSLKLARHLKEPAPDRPPVYLVVGPDLFAR